MKSSTRPGKLGFRFIGILKLSSGALALIVGIGVFRFLGSDPGQAIEQFVTRLRLDPNTYVIRTVLSVITGIDRSRLRALEAGTFFYALLHIIEGTGLILGKDWAGYLVIIATSSLVPFEVYEILHKVSLLRITVFVINVGIVIYLIVTLRKEHQARSERTP